jgi:hypothetical protein
MNTHQPPSIYAHRLKYVFFLNMSRFLRQLTKKTIAPKNCRTMCAQQAILALSTKLVQYALSSLEIAPEQNNCCFLSMTYASKSRIAALYKVHHLAHTRVMVEHFSTYF